MKQFVKKSGTGKLISEIFARYSCMLPALIKARGYVFFFNYYYCKLK